MTDTDKYEGHTEGPWTLYRRAGGKPTIAGKLSEVDWELIADAPLLLAEVKRLREENRQQWLRIQELNEEINIWHRGDEEE